MTSVKPEQSIVIVEETKQNDESGKKPEMKNIIRSKDSPDFIRPENKENIGKEEILGFTEDIDKPLEQRHLGNQDYYRDCPKDEKIPESQGNVGRKEKQILSEAKEGSSPNIGGEILGERSDIGNQNMERFAEKKDENKDINQEFKGINLIDKPEGTILKDDKNLQSAKNQESSLKENLQKQIQ
jgi:hypothetical protein